MRSKVDSFISVTLKDLMRWEYYVQVKEILPRRRVSSVLAGKHVSKMRGRGLDFEEVRTYVAGDDIRNIDWKVTARTRKTHSKVFVEEKERPSVTIVDQSCSMFFGSTKYMKSVIAANAAALHAFRTIKMGDRFGGWVFNNHSVDYVKPHRSKNSIQQFLKVLEKYNNALVSNPPKISNEVRLNKVLYQVKNAVTHDYVISIISDFNNSDSETFRYLITLSKHNDILLLHVTDPLEQEINTSKILLSDGELQLTYNNIRHGSKLNKDSISGQQKLKDLADKYRMVYLHMSTTESLEKQIKEVFGNVGN